MAKILVVDDQVNIQKLLESILQSKGHQVTSVANAHDAHEKLENYTYDLIITDIMMPGGVTGFDLTTSVRKSERHATVPVITITGRREARDVERAIAAGTDDYIVKPIDPDILLSKVDSLLAKAPAKVSNFQSASVTVSAAWDIKTELIGISELGVTIRSELSAAVGSKVKIQCELFDDIGMSIPLFRVASSRATVHEGNNQFITELHFIGVGEKSLQPLRLWIRSHQLKKSS